jgi:hypothetical protein
VTDLWNTLVNNWQIIGAIVFIIAIAVFKLILLPEWDRERIAESIETGGGKVIDIERRRLGGVGGRYMRTFDVTYITRHGKRLEATCITNITRGVIWISDRAPGNDARSEREPIECLECEARIPVGKVRCPHCGWSYEGRY